MEKHLHPEEFTNFMTHEQMKHIAECDFCCQQYANYVEISCLLTAPKDFRTSVISQLQPAIRLPQKLQFFRYILRVSIALCGAFFLLGMGPLISPVLTAKSQTMRKTEYTQTISAHFNQLKSRIFEMEVFPYD